MKNLFQSRPLRLAAAALVMALSSSASQAVVTYTFSGVGGAFAGLDPKPVSFTLSVPDFVQGFFTSFELSQLSAHSGLAWGPNLIADNTYSAIGISANNNAGYGFIFQPGALQAPGFYVTLGGGNNVGTLEVAGSGPLPAVPEPQTWAMLAAGLFFIGFRARRRLSA